MRSEVTNRLDGLMAEQYDALVRETANAMFYHSLKYLKFLASFIQAAPFIAVCYEGAEVLGALPGFIKESTDFGAVLNSLPFYGSHGGAILSKKSEQRERVIIERLLEEIVSLCSRENVVASTIVTTPFEKRLDDYRRILAPRYEQNRITQMVTLPDSASEAQLLATFEKRGRWAIKKALDSNVSVKTLQSIDRTLADSMHEIHSDNMQKSGAPVKPRLFFDKFSDFFEIHVDYDVYVAEFRGITVATLLVFYFNDMAEYFVPAVKVEYRTLNPMNVILLKAMTEAVQRGCKIWNFGGTHEGMDGVYMFKRSFGAKDYNYRYLTCVSEQSSLVQETPSRLKEAYPWFYVLPYSALR